MIPNIAKRHLSSFVICPVTNTLKSDLFVRLKIIVEIVLLNIGKQNCLHVEQ